MIYEFPARAIVKTMQPLPGTPPQGLAAFPRSSPASAAPYPGHGMVDTQRRSAGIIAVGQRSRETQGRTAHGGTYFRIPGQRLVDIQSGRAGIAAAGQVFADTQNEGARGGTIFKEERSDSLR